MKSMKLLPYRYKIIGWVILVPSLLAGLLMLLGIDNFASFTFSGKTFAFVSGDLMKDNQYFQVISTDLKATLAGTLITAGALLVAFSREKVEDEFIAALRLSSFQWAVLVSYTILFFCFLFVFGIPFFTVMSLNMFTVILLFIIRFNFLLYRNKKHIHEK